jgi:hypothetical protein
MEETAYFIRRMQTSVFWKFWKFKAIYGDPFTGRYLETDESCPQPQTVFRSYFILYFIHTLSRSYSKQFVYGHNINILRLAQKEEIR